MVLGHMDHVLLGGPHQWAGLRPAAVLQVGGHLTSKRLAQFLDWAALGGQGRCGLCPPPPPPPFSTLSTLSSLSHPSVEGRHVTFSNNAVTAAKLGVRYQFSVVLLRALVIACRCCNWHV